MIVGIRFEIAGLSLDAMNNVTLLCMFSLQPMPSGLLNSL